MATLTERLEKFSFDLELEIRMRKACCRICEITFLLFLFSIGFFVSYGYLPHDCETYNSFAGGVKIGNSTTKFYRCDKKLYAGKKITYNCRNGFNQKTIYKSYDNNTVCSFSDDYTEEPLDYPTNIYVIYYDKSHKCYLQQNENLNSCNISYVMLSFGALFFIICLIIQISCNPYNPLCSHTLIKCCMGLPSKITSDNIK